MEIYLDNAATTKPLQELKEFATAYMESGWYNPSSLYKPAAKVHADINEARKALLNALRAEKGELLFTSGGTEANNMAIASFAGRKRHFVTTETEHPSLYEYFKSLSREGHEVDFIKPKSDFTVDASDVAAAVRPDTALVSIMHVNNETGAINDIAAIAAAVKKTNPETVFHSDGVQAFMKIPFRMANSLVDLYTVSAHKIHAFKGTGALYAVKKSLLKPLFLGGAQEGNLRAGTENTWGITAFGFACEKLQPLFEGHTAHMCSLRKRLVEGLSRMGDVVLNAAPAPKSAPHILNASFLGVRAEVLLHALEEEGLYIGTGSACSSRKNTASRVLAAMGFARERLEGAVRLSLSPFTTAEEVDKVLEVLYSKSAALRKFKRR